MRRTALADAELGAKQYPSLIHSLVPEIVLCPKSTYAKIGRAQVLNCVRM